MACKYGEKKIFISLGEIKRMRASVKSCYDKLAGYEEIVGSPAEIVEFLEEVYNEIDYISQVINLEIVSRKIGGISS